VKFFISSDTPEVYTSESLARRAVVEGGGQWVGIQECEAVSYTLILFKSPTTHSTLALRSDEISAKKVAQRIKESDMMFEKALLGENL
jgi:hypothetical protein